MKLIKNQSLASHLQTPSSQLKLTTTLSAGESRKKRKTVTRKKKRRSKRKKLNKKNKKQKKQKKTAKMTQEEKDKKDNEQEMVVLNLEDENNSTNNSTNSEESEEVEVEVEADLEAAVEKKQQLGDVVTLKKVDFKVKKGEFVCIIGEVKSGKSSILSSVIGDMLYVSEDKIKRYGGEMGFNQVMCEQETLEKF